MLLAQGQAQGAVFLHSDNWETLLKVKGVKMPGQAD